MVYVNDYLPEVSFTATNGVDNFGFGFFEFQNTSVNTDNYVWSIDGDFFFDEEDIQFFPQAQENQSYLIELIGYTTDINCSDTANLLVNQYDTNLLIIPEAFTPNGDGINESFTVESRANLDYAAQIFNRWGGLMHKTEGKLIVGENQIWDGKRNNQKVPTATYYYVIEINANTETDNFVQPILELKSNYAGFVYVGF